MTRQTRTLLLMALLAVAGVIALGVMADRYGKVLTEGRVGREPGAAPAPNAVDDGARRNTVGERLEAERLVGAWIRARVALGEADERAVAGVLAGVGLTAESYESLEAVHRAWREGRGDGRALFLAFEKRREELDVLDAEPGSSR